MARKPAGFTSLSHNPLELDLRSLVHINPLELRKEVLCAISQSVSVCTSFLSSVFNETEQWESRIERLDCLYTMSRSCIPGGFFPLY